MTYTDVITKFEPTLLDIEDVDILISAVNRANFLIYGEIHGIQENADVIYTLAHRLGIERIAVEASPKNKGFIDAISEERYDFSLVDTDVFDTSILSIEVAKTLGILLKEKVIKEILYIDTYFDTLDLEVMDDPDSPQIREQQLAQNILGLDESIKTLCIMGQWHTQPKPVQLENGKMHVSALCRIREVKSDVPFTHNLYRSGKLFNDGREIELPYSPQLPSEYRVTKVSEIDYDLSVPNATRISLPV